MLYDLVGIVHHSGTLSRGHYVAHVCEGGRWFLCDDASVTEATEAEVAATAQTATPYLLFYVRRRFSPSFPSPLGASADGGSATATTTRP